MEEHKMTESSEDLSPEVLKKAMKAFKKRLKLTALDEDSRLGRGAFSAGTQGICAIQPPNQYPPEVWEELCRQGNFAIADMGFSSFPEPNRVSK